MDDGPNPLLMLDGCTKVSPATGLFISLAGSTLGIAAVLWHRSRKISLERDKLEEMAAIRKRQYK